MAAQFDDFERSAAQRALDMLPRRPTLANLGRPNLDLFD